MGPDSFPLAMSLYCVTQSVDYVTWIEFLFFLQPDFDITSEVRHDS